MPPAFPAGTGNGSWIREPTRPWHRCPTDQEKTGYRRPGVSPHPSGRVCPASLPGSGPFGRWPSFRWRFFATPPNAPKDSGTRGGQACSSIGRSPCPRFESCVVRHQAMHLSFPGTFSGEPRIRVGFNSSRSSPHSFRIVPPAHPFATGGKTIYGLAPEAPNQGTFP